MIRPRQLFLFSLLVANSVFGDGENIGKSQITEDLKKGNFRKDADQDPFTSITFDNLAGDPHSTLFSTCLSSAASRTFNAKFASIEVVPGSEYIRYVPDSLQLSDPISWNTVTGTYKSILDCAKAAYDGNWQMFKYNGAKCEALNRVYSLDDIPECEDSDSDAVFILSSASKECPIPKFFLGRDKSDTAVCGLVNRNLMTFDEATSFCLGMYPNDNLKLFVNEHPTLTVQNVISTLKSLGYTNTSLWVNTEQTFQSASSWSGNFSNTDWWDGTFPTSIIGSRLCTAQHVPRMQRLRKKS